MDIKYINAVIFMTLLIDLQIITAWYLNHKTFKNIDYIFCLFIFFVHSLLYPAVINNNNIIIQYCHLCLIIVIGLSIFLTDQILILISLETIVIIQLLWVFYDKCILNNNLNTNTINCRTLDSEINFGFGFGKIFNILALFWTVFLSYKFGRSF